MKSQNGISLVEIKTAMYKPETKPIGSVYIEGLGNIATMRTSGIDKNKFQIATTSGWINLDATPNSIKEKLRRLRPQEAEILDGIDRQIAELRAKRENALKEAWKKGNVVTVKEIREKAEADPKGKQNELATKPQ